jgi:hypothetical protein
MVNKGILSGIGAAVWIVPFAIEPAAEIAAITEDCLAVRILHIDRKCLPHAELLL